MVSWYRGPICVASSKVTKALGRLSDYLEDARRLKAGMGAGARDALRGTAVVLHQLLMNDSLVDWSSRAALCRAVLGVVGPGRNCSPRHRMPSNSRNEIQTALDDAADSGPGRHCSPRHRMPF